MRCPFCLNDNIILTEGYSRNSEEYVPMAECIDCGLRAPGPDPNEEDVDARAWQFWGEMYEPLLEVWNWNEYIDGDLDK